MLMSSAPVTRAKMVYLYTETVTSCFLINDVGGAYTKLVAQL